MAWIRSPRKRDACRGVAAAEVVQHPEDAEQEAHRDSNLMVLTRSAAGGALFQLHSFRDAETASEFIADCLPGGPGSGAVIVFWALTRQPPLWDPPDASLEAVVLIRDASGPAAVYVFSFSEMLAAQSFARRELESGIDTASLLIYWAIPVELADNGSGELALSPSSMPTFPIHSVPFVDFEAEQGWHISEMAFDEPESIDPTVGSIDDSRTPPLADEQASPDHEYDRDEIFRQESEPLPAVPEQCLLDDKSALEDIGTQRGSEDFGATLPRYVANQSGEFDIVEEVRRVLLLKRWDQQDGPFRGFDSPPGKF